MKAERYALEMSESGMVFEFVSEGPRGPIPKVVIFSKMDDREIYNLGFGDWNPISREMDDQVRSNNGDTERVLGTVVQTVRIFTEQFPDAAIFAKGSTTCRTRLYQMGLSKYLESITADFELYGLVDGNWEPFARGGKYEAFLAARISDYE
jgi:hypothetical protein